MQTTGDMAEQAICFAAERVANRIEEMVSNIDRPSVRFRPQLSRDGNKWIALYGDNLQTGVVGVGESPGEAMFHFDIEWDKRILTDDEIVVEHGPLSPKLGKYRVKADWQMQQAFGVFTIPKGVAVEVEEVTYQPDRALVRFGNSVEWVTVLAPE